jgi:predicted nuclease with TOPRIM domain
MRGQKHNGESPDVIPFARPEGEAEPNNNRLDQAGQAILQLVGKAAEITEGNNRQAIDRAQKLSHQLHAAEDRIKQLEAEAVSLQEKADHAERWLHRVYTEIESRFLSQDPRRTARH